MATVIDALIITLGLDPKGVGTGLAQTRTVLDSGVKNIATKIIAPLTAMLAVAFAGGAIISRFVDAAELGKTSKQLRVGVEDLQAWQGAAVMAGGSAQGLINSAKTLREKTGSRLPITAQLLHMADRLKDLSEIRALELGAKMGLDEGTIKLLRQGRQAVNDLVNQQRELVAFTAQDIAAAQSLKRSYEALKSIFYMVGNVITKLFLPPLRLVSEKLQVAGGIVPWVTEKLAGMSKWIGQNGPQIQNVFTALAAVLARYMIPTLWSMARAALAAMLPFVPFILLVGALALVFDSLMTYINGGESALAGFLAPFGTGPELAAKLAAAWEQLKAVGLALWKGLKRAASMYFDYFAPAIAAVQQIFSALGDFIAAMLSGNFEQAGAALRQVFEGVIAYIKAIFQGLFSIITDGIKGLLNMLPSMDGLKGMASGAWDSISGAAKGMYAGFAGESVRPESTKVGGGTSVQSETKIDKIEVYTQATDAQGIANGIGGATKNAFNSNNLSMAANSGVQQK